MPDEERTERLPPSEGPAQASPAGGGGWATALDRGRGFGRYLILQQIGSGGMGAVYAAYDPVLDRKVALKILHDRVASVEAEQRLLREAQAMARLSHPNVVAVHDAGTHDGRPFVAMEFVEGRDLASWLKAADRGWREVVEVFAAAGEGLGAAHRAGLVHRDFKPSNVMVGSDGRVRVTDFGLARAAGVRTEEGLTLPPQPPSRSSADMASSSPLETPLTQDGWVLGTPTFMAPEQALEGRADQLSDQFSFCVSLYLALYGRHPLGTFESIPEYVARLSLGRVEPPPPGHSVPARLHAVVVRGLSMSPEDRFPDMDDLLDALRADPARRRRRWLAAGLVAACVAAAVALAAGWWVHRRQLCVGGPARFAEVWNDQRSEALAGYFAEVAGRFGAETAAAVAARLDGYGDSWAGVYRTACEATRLRGEQSAALLDRQMACLDRRLREVDHLLALLEGADRDLVAAAFDAVIGLRSPAVCGDTAALVERMPLPEDAGLRARVDELGGELAAAEASRLAGDYQGCLDRLAGAAEASRGVAYPPLLAETLVAKGYIEAELGQADEAEASLREALAAAERGRDDRAAALAASNLLWVAGYLRDRFDEAEQWGALADAKVARLGGDERLAADLADTRASVLLRAGRYDEARAVQERALELLLRIHGPDSLDAAMAMTTMGHVLSSIGEYEAAVERYRRALEIKEAVVGPSHPTVAATAVSLAQAYGGLGDNERAVELSRRALAIQEDAFGADDPQLAVALNNLAYGLEGLGLYDEARAAHERSLQIVSRAWGPDHPQLAYTWLNLSSLERRTGHLDAALDAARRAGEILMAAYGPDHPLYAYAANNTGVFLMLLGRASEGVSHLEKALAIRSQGASDPVLLEVTRFNLGRALWEAGQQDRGRRLVRRSRDALATMGERAREDLEAAESWLAEH